jgi:DNA-binding NarL/FixJ family response regulator
MDSAHVGEMAQIRVVLADDHPIVRSGIRGLLEREPDIAVVAETRDGVAALRLARDLTPDVLLLDLELPELSGVEVARRIRQDGSAARVLVLSAHDDEAHILGLLAHGAAGYLTKAEAPGRIVDAVRGVARGETGWFSQSVAATVARAAQERARSTRADTLFTLTARAASVDLAGARPRQHADRGRVIRLRGDCQEPHHEHLR